jgi:hypothetical protein
LRLAEDVLPFETVHVGAEGHDLLPQTEMIVARSSTGWQVGMVDDNGITKTPSGVVRVDASHDLAMVLQLRPACG